MKQIADWFEKLGISEYTERCAENRIDLSVHLEELDVALGHRLRILRAIREPSATVAVAQPAASATRVVHDTSVAAWQMRGASAVESWFEARITYVAQQGSFS